MIFDLARGPRDERGFSTYLTYALPPREVLRSSHETATGWR